MIRCLIFDLCCFFQVEGFNLHRVDKRIISTKENIISAGTAAHIATCNEPISIGNTNFL